MDRAIDSGTAGGVEDQPGYGPALDPRTFMRELYGELSAQGVFRGDARGYAARSAWVLGLCATTWYCLLQTEGWGTRLVLAVVAAYAAVQAAAIAHEAGHGAVTRRRARAQAVGRLFMTALIGMAYSAWVDRHRSHHRRPNSAEDPDARQGMFSFTEDDARRAGAPDISTGCCGPFRH